LPTDSVIKLKFREGDFGLYGGTDRQLSFYGVFGGDWEDVRVTLEAFAGYKAIEVIGLTDEKEPPVYKPRGQSFSSTLSKGSGSSKTDPVDLTKRRRQSSSSSSSRKGPKAPTIKLKREAGDDWWDITECDKDGRRDSEGDVTRCGEGFAEATFEESAEWECGGYFG
jgi:hypothetical protein